MKVSIGIDCGSRTIKMVVINIMNYQIIDSSVTENGLFPLKIINDQFNKILLNNKLEIDNIVCIAGTGYGRNSIVLENLESVKESGIICHIFSEISCHAKGTHQLLPFCPTIIDIGGQDSKIINISNQGKVLDFVMNDKCAAGTGRFLEKLAQILNMNIDDLDCLAVKHNKVVSISSTCVVFAESEIIGLLAKEEKAENIIYSIYQSIARRIVSQAGSVSVCKPIAFVGGVAHHHSIKTIFSELFSSEVFSPENPSITGALGAAILAIEQYKKQVEK